VRDVVLFDTPYLEIFTKTPWFIVPIVWFPVSMYHFSLSELTLIGGILTTFAGILLWTLVEYILHRFVFHGEDYWLPPGNVASTLHFAIHGIHHAFP